MDSDRDSSSEMDSDEDSECSSSNMSDILINEQTLPPEDTDTVMMDATQYRQTEITANGLNSNSTPHMIGVNNQNQYEIDSKMDESMSSLESLTEIINSTVSCDLKSLENLATNFTQISDLDDVTKQLITSSMSTSTTPSPSQLICSTINPIPIKSDKSNDATIIDENPKITVNTRIVNGYRHAVRMALSNTSDDNDDDKSTENNRHAIDADAADAADDTDIDGDDESNGDEDTDVDKRFIGFNGLINSPALPCNTREQFCASDNAQNNQFCDNQLVVSQVNDNVLNSSPIDRYPLRNKSNVNLVDSSNPSNNNSENNIVKHLDAMETVSNLRSILDDLARISSVKISQKAENTNAIESPGSRQTRQTTKQNAQSMEILPKIDESKLPELRPVFVQLERINLADYCHRLGIVINNANNANRQNLIEKTANNVTYENDDKRMNIDEIDVCAKFGAEHCTPNEIETVDISNAIASEVEIESKQEPIKVQPQPDASTKKNSEKTINNLSHAQYPIEKVEQIKTKKLSSDKKNPEEIEKSIKSGNLAVTREVAREQSLNFKILPENMAERSQNDQRLNIENSVANDNTKILIINCNGIIDTSQFIDVEEQIASNVIQVREAVINDDEIVANIENVDQIPSQIESKLSNLIVENIRCIAPPKNAPKLKSKQPRNNSITIDLYCYICDTQFWRTNHFRRHLNSHSVRELMNCNKCDIKFSRFIELNGHMIDVHTTIDTICVQCKLNFRNPLHLGQHVRAVHMEKNRKTHKCNICAAAYTCRSDIANHMVSHFTRAFICCTCNESFPSQQLVKEHLKLHATEQLVQPEVDRTYECYLCKKEMNSYRALTEHIRSHTIENYQFIPTHNTLTAFTCELCLRRFRKIATLQKHMALHMNNENDSTFIQSIQSATSTNVERNKRHIRFDNVNRNYKCEQCNETFETDAERRRHSLSHTNEITYECDICQNSYRRKENLHKHQQTKHGYEFIPPTLDAYIQTEHNYDAV